MRYEYAYLKKSNEAFQKIYLNEPNVEILGSFAHTTNQMTKQKSKQHVK